MKFSFPHYLQHDAMDCGPTCLRMIAAHYGKVFSLEGLRERSGITREGVSMLAKFPNFVVLKGSSWHCFCE